MGLSHVSTLHFVKGIWRTTLWSQGNSCYQFTELKLRHTELKLAFAITSLLIFLSLECHVSKAFVIKMTLMQTLQISQPRPQGAFPWLWKSALGTRLQISHSDVRS